MRKIYFYFFIHSCSLFYGVNVSCCCLLFELSKYIVINNLLIAGIVECNDIIVTTKPVGKGINDHNDEITTTEEESEVVFITPAENGEQEIKESLNEVQSTTIVEDATTAAIIKTTPASMTLKKKPNVVYDPILDMFIFSESKPAEHVNPPIQENVNDINDHNGATTTNLMIKILIEEVKKEDQKTDNDTIIMTSDSEKDPEDEEVIEEINVADIEYVTTKE